MFFINSSKMKQIKLKTSSREKIGGNSAKAYRRNGQIPAVIYGENGEKNLLVDAKTLDITLKEISGKAVLLELEFDDGTQPRFAMLKAAERNPLTGAPLHVDFVEVVRGKPMKATLPLHFAGESYGVKNENGVIEIHEHEVSVRCRPRDLPEMIVIDISELRVGQAIHLKDVKAPEGVEFEAHALEDILVTCNAVDVEEAAPAATDAAASAAVPATEQKAAEEAPKK